MKPEVLASEGSCESAGGSWTERAGYVESRESCEQGACYTCSGDSAERWLDCEGKGGANVKNSYSSYDACDDATGYYWVRKGEYDPGDTIPTAPMKELPGGTFPDCSTGPDHLDDFGARQKCLEAATFLSDADGGASAEAKLAESADEYYYTIRSLGSSYSS